MIVLLLTVYSVHMFFGFSVYIKKKKKKKKKNKKKKKKKKKPPLSFATGLP